MRERFHGLNRHGRGAGYQVRENGEPDGYSHRKKMSVAEALSAEMIRRDGVEAVVSDLTYDLRGGPERPDGGDSPRLLRMAPIPDPQRGPRNVEVATM